jgi:hypothetical protein
MKQPQEVVDMSLETVDSLRKKGYKVNVRHHREFSYGLMRPKGGATYVLIQPPPTSQAYGYVTTTSVGVSKCSKHDYYVRKRGVRLALDRALSQLQNIHIIESLQS